MTHTIELPPPIEAALEAKARQCGLGLDDYLRDLAERDAQSDGATPQANRQAEIAARLAAWESFGTAGPDERAAAGVGPLDLSGPRGDVYGYTEREDEQR